MWSKQTKLLYMQLVQIGRRQKCWNGDKEAVASLIRKLVNKQHNY